MRMEGVRTGASARLHSTPRRRPSLNSIGAALDFVNDHQVLERTQGGVGFREAGEATPCDCKTIKSQHRSDMLRRVPCPRLCVGMF